MKTMKKNKRKGIFGNQRGQGATEYVLLLAVVAGLIILFKTQIRDQVNKLIGNTATQLQDAGSP